MLALDLVEVGGEQVEVRVDRGHTVACVQQVLHLVVVFQLISCRRAVKTYCHGVLTGSPPPQ